MDKFTSVNEKNEQIKKMSLRTATEQEMHDVANNLLLTQCYDFDELIAAGITDIKKHTIIGCDGITYLVMQDTTLQSHFRPSGDGLLAIFQPHQGNHGVLPWMYGEYCEIGYLRTYDNVTYEAYQLPNANIYPPNQVPAIWRVYAEPFIM